VSLRIKEGKLYRTANGYPVRTLGLCWELRWGFLPWPFRLALLGFESGLHLACVYWLDGRPKIVSGFSETIGFEILWEIPSTRGLRSIPGGQGGKK